MLEWPKALGSQISFLSVLPPLDHLSGSLITLNTTYKSLNFFPELKACIFSCLFDISPRCLLDISHLTSPHDKAAHALPKADAPTGFPMLVNDNSTLQVIFAFSLSLTPHFQSISKSCWLLKDTPKFCLFLPISTATTAIQAFTIPIWIITKGSQLILSLPHCILFSKQRAKVI